MENIPDHLVPIIAGAFFLCTVIAGFCLYCCYFKQHKHRNKAGRQTRDSDNRGCRVYGNSGQFPSYNLHNNPFLFYMGPAPRAFSEAPLTVEIESKRIPNLPCYLPEKHCNKQPDRKRLCKSTSYDKPSRSSCHLQVITEADEENEEEETKEQIEVTNF